MKFLALSALLIGAACAQSCNNEYGGYLNCIKGKLDANYGQFEKEFGEDYKNLAFSCFSTTPADAQSGKACVVKDISALGNAFDARGPLGDCQFCLKLAQQVQKLFLEAPETTMRCIRTTVTDIIGKEMNQCVKKRYPQFNIPAIPDFDAKSQPFRKQIIDNVGTFVQVDAILDRCERNSERRNGRAKRSSYSNSQSCIDRRVLNGKPIWAQHCSAIKSCHASVASSCQADFKKVEGAACDCIEQGRQEIGKLINQVGQELVSVAKATSPQGGSCPGGDLGNWKICQCKAIANKVIKQNANNVDVNAVLEKVIGCTDIPQAQKDLVSMDKFLDIGCKRLGQTGNAGLVAAAELATGVDFLGKLLDALVARVSRFCPNASCRV